MNNLKEKFTNLKEKVSNKVSKIKTRKANKRKRPLTLEELEEIRIERKVEEEMSKNWMKPIEKPLTWVDKLFKKLEKTVRSKRFAISKELAKYCAIYLVIIVAIVAIGAFIVIANEYENTKKAKADLEIYVAQLEDSLAESEAKNGELQERLMAEQTEYKETANTYQEVIDEQTKIIDTMKEDNTKLASEYDTMKESYDKLKTRKELYDKYKYAIWYDGKRTDLTYDEIVYGEELCKEKGLNPHLLFGIGMVESRYDRTCTMSSSTARGYHQILIGTGKFTWEKWLGNSAGSYNHDMAFNGKTNIKLATSYLHYLYTTNNKDFYKMIRRYRGKQDISGYTNGINQFLKQSGMSLEKVRMSM